MPSMYRDPLSLGMDHGTSWMRALCVLAPSLRGGTIGIVPCPCRDCGSPPIPPYLPLSKPFQEGKITASTWPARGQNSIPRRAGVSLLSFHEFRKHQLPMSPLQLFSPSRHRPPFTTIQGERKMATGSQGSHRFFQLRELRLYVYPSSVHGVSRYSPTNADPQFTNFR